MGASPGNPASFHSPGPCALGLSGESKLSGSLSVAIVGFSVWPFAINCLETLP